MEIVLLAAGAAAFIISFLIPGRSDKREQDEQQIDEEIIREIIDKEMEDARSRVTEVVDETLEYAVEKTERASERISNEKIMAISEYSETVLSDMNKAHQEVMFLYDMLNDKHNNLKETVKHVDKTAKEAEEAANAAAIALAAKAREEAEARKAQEEAARKEERERNAALERAAREKAAREKEYARKQMARLILPMQQELVTQRQALNFRKEEPQQGKTEEFSPLVFKDMEVLPADRSINPSDLRVPGARPESLTVVDAKPADIRPVEVYSFVEQAPHIERPVKQEAQAVTLERTVSMMKQQETEDTAVPVEDMRENNNDRILRMYKEGLSHVDIAKELGLGVGEVKLVINLFKGAV
ncbi:MAG: DUF6115 domain-containing protein [Roseburia sp.]|nr:DUF6115 domain-containing protein [Roseburia sp.]